MTLKMKELMAKMLTALKVDYITEQGVDGIWHYRKWNSGVAECWGDWSSGAFAPDGQTAGWYRRLLSNQPFPTNFFTETPKAFFDLTSWGAGYYWGTVRSLTKDTYQIAVYRNDNASSVGRGSIYAIGKWK